MPLVSAHSLHTHKVPPPAAIIAWHWKMKTLNWPSFGYKPTEAASIHGCAILHHTKPYRTATRPCCNLTPLRAFTVKTWGPEHIFLKRLNISSQQSQFLQINYSKTLLFWSVSSSMNLDKTWKTLKQILCHTFVDFFFLNSVFICCRTARLPAVRWTAWEAITPSPAPRSAQAARAAAWTACRRCWMTAALIWPWCTPRTTAAP